MSLTTDDGADDGWADDAASWTGTNFLLGGDYPGGSAPAAPTNDATPAVPSAQGAGVSTAVLPGTIDKTLMAPADALDRDGVVDQTSGATPAAPSGAGAGVSTAVLPTTIDKALMAPVGALTRDHVLDRAGDLLAGLPPELFGQVLGPTIDFTSSLPDDDAGLRDSLERLRRRFPTARQADAAPAGGSSAPDPNAVDVSGPKWAQVLAQAGADWSAGRTARAVPGEATLPPVGPAGAGAQVVDDGDGIVRTGIGSSDEVDVGELPLWKQVQASALAKMAGDVRGGSQFLSDLQSGAISAGVKNEVGTSKQIGGAFPGRSRQIHYGQNHAAVTGNVASPRRSESSLLSDVLSEVGQRIRHPDRYLQPLPSGLKSFGVDDRGNLWVTEENGNKTAKVWIPSASSYDAAAAEASRENLETIGMAGMDPLSALVGDIDWLCGVSPQERYRHMLLAWGIGQAGLGAGGSIAAADAAAAPFPEVSEAPFEPVGGELNGKNTGVDWRGGIQGQGIPYEVVVAKHLSPTAKMLPRGSKVWDVHDPASGVVISAKTLNTSARGYMTRPSRVHNRLIQYVKSAANYDGRGKGSAVDPATISSREVHIAVPKGITPEQRMQIERARVYARSRGVKMVIDYSN